MIAFASVEIPFVLKNKRITRAWLKAILENEKKEVGDITYIFCNDNYLLSMNEKYLKHDTLTDIITFDYSENNLLAGDIFISIERVKENAVSFETTFAKELTRVMAHGVLHLCGYKDKSAKDSKLMRSKEDYYLAMSLNE